MPQQVWKWQCAATLPLADLDPNDENPPVAPLPCTNEANAVVYTDTAIVPDGWSHDAPSNLDWHRQCLAQELMR